MTITSWIYQNRIIARSSRIINLLESVRKHLIKFYQDPPCQMKIHGMEMTIPLSHNLPIYLNDYPLYDQLPKRLSKFIHSRHGRVQCIDVGANVGDTVAAFRLNHNDTFLAIEPNPNFRKYLDLNWGSDPQIKILPFICSSKEIHGNFSIHEIHGTASIKESDHGSDMESKTLDQITTEYTDFITPNIIKVDTDGHDFEVVMGASHFLTKHRPALLFECDSFSNKNYVPDCIALLKSLSDFGYNQFMVYDNFGQLFGTFDLNDLTPFKNLLFYQMTTSFYYFDLLFMNDEDLHLFSKSEVTEIVNRTQVNW